MASAEDYAVNAELTIDAFMEDTLPYYQDVTKRLAAVLLEVIREPMLIPDLSTVSLMDIFQKACIAERYWRNYERPNYTPPIDIEEDI